MSVVQLLQGAGVVAGHGYRAHESMIKEEAIKGYDQASTLGVYGATAGIAMAMTGKFQEGALYSFGGEPIVGNRGFGFVRAADGTQLGGIISGKDNVFNPGKRGGLFSAVTPGSRTAMESEVRSIFAKAGKKGAGVMSQTALSTLLPAGFTLWFAADAYANDGMTGLGKYMVADTLGNYYGTKAALNTFEVTNAAAANKHFGKNLNTPLANKEHLQRVAPIMGSGLLGRMIPTIGGIMGATIGMEIGASVGSAVTSLMGVGGPSDTSGAIAGGLLGTIAGAKFGAAAMSGIPTALVAGLGIAATTAIVSRNMDALKSGFNTERGLNFAGETAQYFTQNAVTMRERAVQSMHKSHMNARSAFGQEASLMHMNRDMFSQYKRPLR
jgi:hypothetical protein